MKVRRRGIVISVFVVVLILLNIFGGNITGNVVEDLVDVGNCSNDLIYTLWDNVFDVENSDLNILKENVAGGDMCEKYVAYKNNSDGEIWVLYESFYDSSWTGMFPRYENGKKILNEIDLLAFYFDVNKTFLESYVFVSDVEGVAAIKEDIGNDDLVNWSILDESSARTKIESILDIDISGLGFVEYGDSFKHTGVSSGDWQDFDYVLGVFKNESMVFIEDYEITNYDPSFVVDFVTNVSDFVFDRNSSWNHAFNVSDHFNVSDDIVISFSSIGANNTNGEWINSSIVGEVVSFMPAVNFTGYREFRMMADNPAGADVFSNVFNVMISIPNDAPVLLRRFEAIAVPRVGGAKVVLSVYFEDPDGDDMTYRVSGDDDLNVTLSGGLMTIRLEENFSDTTQFKVYASDGIEETGSNSFYVYEAGDAEAAALVEGLVNNESVDLDGVLVNENAGDGNESGTSVGVGDGDTGSGRVFLWIVVVVVVLLLVLFAIWYFFLRKNGGGVPGNSGGVGAPSPPAVPGVSAVPGVPIKNVPQGPGSPVQNPVNSYLSNLNLPKR